MKIEALRSVLESEEKVMALAARHTLDMLGDGTDLHRAVSPEEVINGLISTINTHSTDEQTQREYAATVENMMAFRDEKMLNGEWDIIYTEPDDPFVIGDAPVVTWDRISDTQLLYGIGFSRPNVEILLPLSPTACLHLKPLVHRARRVKAPTTREVNEAQAAYSTRHCFSNLRSDALNSILLPRFGEVSIDAFHPWERIGKRHGVIMRYLARG